MPAPARIIAKLGSYEIVFRPEPAVRWSAAMFRILGLEPATKSLPAREYISRCDHPSDRSRVRNAVEHSLLKGTGHDLYCRIVCPDGSVRRIRCVAEPFDESVNARRRIIGTLADTTE